MNVCDPLWKHAKKQPEKIAIHAGENSITYKKLSEKVSGVANQLLLHENSLKKASDISVAAILMKNEPEALEMFLGAAYAGWTAAPLDPKWSRHETNAILDHVRPDVIFVHVDYLDLVQGLLYEPAIVVCGEEDSHQTYPSYRHWWKKTQPAAIHKDTHAENPFYLGFTSGTTGLPKGFLRSHRSWIESFRVWDEEINWQQSDTFYVPGPLVHSLFLFAALHALHLGATCTLERSFHAKKVAQKLTDENISAMYAVPTMLEAISRMNSDVQKTTLKKIISSGAKAEINTEAWWAANVPEAEWLEFYGASELSFVSLLRPEDKKERGSLGLPFSNVETFIQKDDGQEAVAGEIGELFIRSPMVFSGYYDDVQNPQEWLSAGDLVRKDASGRLFLTGRKKNMIVSGGLNVYPEEVEQVLKKHPEVTEAIVFGEKDAYWGEIIIAVVTVKEDAAFSEERLSAYCKERLSRYKCPKEWRVLKEIPYTSSGKPSRRKAMDIVRKEQKS